MSSAGTNHSAARGNVRKAPDASNPFASLAPMDGGRASKVARPPPAPVRAAPNMLQFLVGMAGVMCPAPFLKPLPSNPDYQQVPLPVPPPQPPPPQPLKAVEKMQVLSTKKKGKKERS